MLLARFKRGMGEGRTEEGTQASDDGQVDGWRCSQVAAQLSSSIII